MYRFIEGPYFYEGDNGKSAIKEKQPTLCASSTFACVCVCVYVCTYAVLKHPLKYSGMGKEWLKWLSVAFIQYISIYIFMKGSAVHSLKILLPITDLEMRQKDNHERETKACQESGMRWSKQYPRPTASLS